MIVCNIEKHKQKHVGKKIDRLEIVDLFYNKRNHLYAVCRCNCGKIKHIFLYSVLNGRIKSCGCLMYQYQKGPKSYLWKGYGDISSKQWKAWEYGAKVRGLPFDISIQDAWNVYLRQDGRCFLSGEKIVFADCDRNHLDRTASLDRLDSKKGYIDGNVVWVHKDLNEMKWDLSLTRFVELCFLISYPLNISECKINDSCILKKHNNSFIGYGNIGMVYWNRLLSHAKKRNIPVIVTIEECWNIFLQQNGYCALTGLSIYFNGKCDTTASLDRIDSKRPYIIDNVQWVHKDINYKIKKHYSEERVRDWAKKVTDYCLNEKPELIMGEAKNCLRCGANQFIVDTV